MSDISEDTVHRIVTEKLAVAVERLEKTDDKLEGIALQSTIDLSTIKTTLGAIYGNGSGKKGILERIEEKQKEDNERVKSDLVAFNKSTQGQLVEFTKKFEAEMAKQQSFRHEARNQWDTQQKVEAEKTRQELEAQKHKKDNLDWVKWVAGGIALMLWELSKDSIKKKFGLG